MADAILADVESSGIYQIRNIKNGKRYVGSAVNVRQRWASHRSLLRKGKHHSDHLQNSWKKYGEQSFEFEVIELCEKGSLIEREQWHINQGCHYNKAPIAGSPLGVKWSKSARERASARRAGVRKSSSHVEAMRTAFPKVWKRDGYAEKMKAAISASYTPELRKLKSDQMKARWASYEYREETIKKIALSHGAERRALTSLQSKERWADPEFRSRMAESASNRIVSEDTKQKISKALTGRNLSIETRKKKSALTDSQVIQIRAMHLDGATYKEIAFSFGVHIGTIARIIRGVRYQWVGA